MKSENITETCVVCGHALTDKDDADMHSIDWFAGTIFVGTVPVPFYTHRSMCSGIVLAFAQRRATRLGLNLAVTLTKPS